MNYGLGIELLDGFGYEGVICEITHKHLDRLSRNIFPRSGTLLKRTDGGKGRRAKLVVPKATNKTIHDADFVPLARQVARGRPSAVAIASQNQYSHLSS